MTRQMKLFHFPLNTGSHAGGWRHPDAASDLNDLGFYQGIAALAEKGRFDALFFADASGFYPIPGRNAFSRADVVKPEPLSLIAALSATTHNLGLVATASTAYNHPFNLARTFATIDHLSRGRAGWNIVTSAHRNVARNFGLDDVAGHEERYARAREFVDVVKGLWDSFDDDALIRDKASGRYFDPDKLHALGHAGSFYSVSGPLDVARPPQGHPVLVQAGGSDTGRRFAVKTAEVIFTSHPTFDSARAFYADIQALAPTLGRDPASLRILPAIHPMIAATETEARAKLEALNALIPIELAVGLLGTNLGDIDLSGYDLDGPLPELPVTNRIRSVQARLQAFASEGNLTLRQLAQRHAALRTGFSLVGAPEQIADGMELWFRNGAADGFVVTAPYLPGGFEIFVEEVVPILQRRGLFRTDYEGPTLRDQLGLSRPPSLFETNPARHVEPDIW